MVNIKRACARYAKFYPEYTKRSVCKAVRKIVSKKIRLSAPTVDHYCKPKRLGGKGICRLKRKR